MLSARRLFGALVVVSAIALNIHAVGAQSSSPAATAIDAIVIVDGKLAPAGTTVDIVSGGNICGTGVTVARDVPMTVGSVLRFPLSGGKSSCAQGASLSARAEGLESAVPAPAASGVIGGALIIGRPIVLVEGTAEQTGAVQPAPDIQIVVGTGPDQRICARAPLVPPVPSAPVNTAPEFSELLLDPSLGCAKLGDRVDLYVGDTIAESINAAPGLTRVELKVNRVVHSLEDRPTLPATGAATPPDDTGLSYRRFLLLALAAAIGLPSAAWLAKTTLARRSR